MLKLSPWTWTFAIIVNVGLFAVLLGTGKTDEPRPVPPAVESFDEAMALGGTITSNGNGTAYAVGAAGGVWLLRGEEAVRVREVTPPATQPSRH